MIENQTRLYQFCSTEELIYEDQYQISIKPEELEQETLHIEEEIEYQVEALEESLLIELPQNRKSSDDLENKNSVWCDETYSVKHQRIANTKSEKGSKKNLASDGRRMCQLCGLSFASNGWYHHVSGKYRTVTD